MSDTDDEDDDDIGEEDEDDAGKGECEKRLRSLDCCCEGRPLSNHTYTENEFGESVRVKYYCIYE